jgi:hypothetical protein
MVGRPFGWLGALAGAFKLGSLPLPGGPGRFSYEARLRAAASACPTRGSSDAPAGGRAGRQRMLGLDIQVPLSEQRLAECHALWAILKVEKRTGSRQMAYRSGSLPHAPHGPPFGYG